MKALLPAPRALYGLTLLACLAAFLGALYMQHVEGLEPCPLCIFQRIALIVVMVILLIAVTIIYEKVSDVLQLRGLRKSASARCCGRR